MSEGLRWVIWCGVSEIGFVESHVHIPPPWDMKLKKCLINVIPNWAVLLAMDLRCLLRFSFISRRFPLQQHSNESALIVAPHPDDETFSCGGLIRLKRADGVDVRILILTDGEAVASAQNERTQSVVEARRREALNACESLGVASESVRWLHLPDGKLPHPGQPEFDVAVEFLLAEIEAFMPGEVYCPHWHDGHLDHIASNHLTRHALLRWSRPCVLYYYPVWMWYHASLGLRRRLDTAGAWRLDISTVLSTKKRAMAAYLDAEKTSDGKPFCGQLPWSFLLNFRRDDEVYFRAQLEDGCQK